jgi:predicted DNA-binding transcriptional regulator AlpA
MQMASTANRYRQSTPPPPLPKLKLEDPRLLSKAEVIELTGKSYPTLWAWMQAGKFPRARNMNGHPVWIESEINQWINALPIRRLKGDSVQEGGDAL